MLKPKEKNKPYSFMSTLYARIPDDHFLKVIDRELDFSFINEFVADSYCLNNGRPAKEPELLMKLLFLQYLFNLSDVKVIQEAGINMAWMWFLGLNPDEELPDPSLLAKFRTQRLKDYTLDDINTEIVRQCVERGLIKSDGISIDTTHIEANTGKLVPERIIQYLIKRIFKALKKDCGSIPPEVNTEIPDWSQIEDHRQAKRVMKECLEQVMKQALPFAGEFTTKAIDTARDVLSDERFILQKGLRSLVDTDARVGRKSKTASFYGYKTEYMMTTDERIITAVDVHSGEYVDGKQFDELMAKTKEAGLQPTEVYGDKAYFRKDILDSIADENAKAYIPVSACSYRVDEENFSYNKDSDQWFCIMGNYTVKKKRRDQVRKGTRAEGYRYTFDKDQCIDCPRRAECMGKQKNKARFLDITAHTTEFYEISQQQKDPAFLEKYKKRAAHEGKNAEMKRFHGLARARGYGLRSVSTQAKLTAIVVNLKRIAALILKKTAVSFSSPSKWQPLGLFRAEFRFSFRPTASIIYS